MKFTMNSPCPKCPFRTDVKPYLTRARANEIADGLTRHQQPFPCHQTTEHDEDGEAMPSNDEIHCAGAAIILERMNRPNQLMRIAERLRQYDARTLKMDAPVFATMRAFVAAQPERRGAR